MAAHLEMMESETCILLQRDETDLFQWGRSFPITKVADQARTEPGQIRRRTAPIQDEVLAHRRIVRINTRLYHFVTGFIVIQDII